MTRQVTDMTELIQGSRFLDLAPDEFDMETEYTPRHLRAVPLSPELQQALDEAFAPEPPPSAPSVLATLPVPEPTPGPSGLDATSLAREAEAHEQFQLTLVVPETIEYPPVLPESIFRAEVAPEVPQPVVIAPAAIEPVVAAPAAAAAIAVEPVSSHAAPVELASVTAFPDPGSYAARRMTEAAVASPAPSLGSRLFRRKVDASRLVVPSA